MQQQHHHRRRSIHTRWPAWVALFVVALLYEALPHVFYLGPRGLMLALVTALTIPLIITYWRSHTRTNRIIGLSINVIITVFMVMSVLRLILAVLQGHIGPEHLLLSSIKLWVTNILVFALWYWSLDAGGPNQRDEWEGTRIAAFLFPQAQISLTDVHIHSQAIKNWQPYFIDYLFLSFNTSTAFSPTDTPVLSRWAKCMCMLQALISLTIVVMFAARAISILNPASQYLVS